MIKFFYKVVELKESYDKSYLESLSEKGVRNFPLTKGSKTYYRNDFIHNDKAAAIQNIGNESHWVNNGVYFAVELNEDICWYGTKLPEGWENTKLVAAKHIKRNEQPTWRNPEV